MELPRFSIRPGDLARQQADAIARRMDTLNGTDVIAARRAAVVIYGNSIILFMLSTLS